MNILPHKSWNVWNKDNIAKVEADELEDQRKKEEIRRKKLAVEQERRYVELRRRRGYTEETEKGGHEVSERGGHEAHWIEGKEQERGEHINFFKEFEDQERKMRSFSGNDFYAENVDYRREKADEDMAKERAEAVFLDSVSKRSPVPFYMCTAKEESKRGPQSTRNEAMRIMAADPLSSIKKGVEGLADPLELPQKMQPPPPKFTKITEEREQDKEHKRDRHHRHKHRDCHHHHHHHKRNKSKRSRKSSSSEEEEEDDELKRMRKERLERERVEKIRQQELVKGRFITHSEVIAYK